jgi:hypothetical protein
MSIRVHPLPPVDETAVSGDHRAMHANASARRGSAGSIPSRPVACCLVLLCGCAGAASPAPGSPGSLAAPPSPSSDTAPPGPSAPPASSADPSPAAGSPASAAPPAPPAPAASSPAPLVPPPVPDKLQLSAADVQPSIASSARELRQSCWEPAFTAKPDGPVTVRLAVEIAANPDGTVNKLNVVGGDAYPGLAACVEKAVKAWRLPAARQPSSLMFPITFARDGAPPADGASKSSGKKKAAKGAKP